MDSVCIGLTSSDRVTFGQMLPLKARHANRQISLHMLNSARSRTFLR